MTPEQSALIGYRLQQLEEQASEAALTARQVAEVVGDVSDLTSALTELKTMLTALHQRLDQMARDDAIEEGRRQEREKRSRWTVTKVSVGAAVMSAMSGGAGALVALIAG